MAELNKTALYTLHKQLAAKMVEFSGYLLPVQYSKGIIDEHLHCRQQASLFDISHMGQALLSGPNIASDLEKLTPAQLHTLAIGQQRYTVLLNEDGGIIDDVIITRLDSAYLLVANAACKQKDFVHINRHLSADSKLTVLHDQALLALQGPEATEIMETLSPALTELAFMHSLNVEIEGMDCMISRSGYTGEDGFELSIANGNAEALAQRLLAFNQVEPAGLGARDTLRLEAGLSLYGHELTEQLTPIDCGLQWLIQRTEGYLGAEKIRQQLAAGADLQRIGLVANSKSPVREGCELLDKDGQKVGTVTSGSYSPSLKQPIALAQISSNNDSQTFWAQVRNHTIQLTKNKLPFMEHQYRR